MLDATPISHQRSRGAARVTIGAGGVRDLFQQGSAKAMLPATHGAVPEVVFLNTSGGLTGGDTLSFDLSVEDGTSAIAATQTAERVYASAGGAARADVRLRIGDGAMCAWLPQETILFNRGALERVTEVHLSPTARFLGIETLVLGREAMGESLASIALSDVRRVWRGGRLAHAEQVAIGDRDLAAHDARAGLAGARVVSSLVYLAADAEDQLARVRRVVGEAAAVSAWHGRLVVRMMHADSWVVRQIMARAVTILAGRVPRVWQM
ncbi:MAG: urease accessory protein UreD [Pseudomonadota bacterium]